MKTRQGEKGIETVCRVCQTNGAGPYGKEIIMGSVSVKHASTIQKRGMGRWEGTGGGMGARGGAAASEGLQKGTRRSPQQHWPCQRMSVIRKAD